VYEQASVCVNFQELRLKLKINPLNPFQEPCCVVVLFCVVLSVLYLVALVLWCIVIGGKLSV
ncbi:hypothetical protein RYX36_030695, partial [Vicia faba]